MPNKFKNLFTYAFCFALFACTENLEKSSPNFTDSSDFIDVTQIEARFLLEIPKNENQGFFFGRIRDARVLADGTIAVLDDIRKTIHFFSQEGLYKGSAIKEGRGPGEVMMPHHNFQVSKDGKISIYDRGLQRLSIYEFIDNELAVITDVKLERMISSHYLLSENVLVLYEPKPIGEKERKDRVLISDLSGSIINDQLAEFEGNEQLILSPRSGDFTMGVSSQYHTKNLVCYQGTKMIYNRSNQVGFRVYDLDTGKVINEVKLNRPSIHLPIENREALIDEIIEPGVTNKDQRLRLLAEMPENYPMVQDIKCDSIGHIWLKITEEEEQHAWIVFSESGELIGKLDTKIAENIINVYKSFIFVHSEDQVGNTSLQVYKYNIDTVK